MKKQNIKKKSEVSEELFSMSYLSPFFITNSISKMIIGYLYIGTYSIAFEGFSARAISFLFFIFGAKPFYDLYIKIPRNFNRNKFEKFKSIVYSSTFLYILVITMVARLLLDYYRLRFRIIIFIILLIFNFIAQFHFNRKYRKIIES